MANKCFRRPGSEPPVCGVHDTQLQETRTSDPNPGGRNFVCRTSGSMIEEASTQPSRQPTPAELESAHNAQLEKRWHLQNEFKVATEAEKPVIQQQIDAVTQDIERLDAAILGYSQASQS